MNNIVFIPERELHPLVEALNHTVCATHAGYTEALHAVDVEIERLTRERDDWAEKWHDMRELYAELKYRGMTGVVKSKELPDAIPFTSEPGGNLPWKCGRCGQLNSSWDTKCGRCELSASI